MRAGPIVRAGIFVAAAVALYGYDESTSYPCSTHISLRVDMTAVGTPERVWYTTNDGVIDMCLHHDSRSLSDFGKMDFEPPTHLAVVGASKAKSALLGRDRGKILWRGRMLIVAERTDELCDVFLVHGMHTSRNFSVGKDHIICEGMSTKKLDRQ